MVVKRRRCGRDPIGEWCSRSRKASTDSTTKAAFGDSLGRRVPQQPIARATNHERQRRSSTPRSRKPGRKKPTLS